MLLQKNSGVLILDTFLLQMMNQNNKGNCDKQVIRFVFRSISSLFLASKLQNLQLSCCHVPFYVLLVAVAFHGFPHDCCFAAIFKDHAFRPLNTRPPERHLIIEIRRTRSPIITGNKQSLGGYAVTQLVEARSRVRFPLK